MAVDFTSFALHSPVEVSCQTVNHRFIYTTKASNYEENSAADHTFEVIHH